MTAEEDGTECVLISGEPLDQTVFQYGPFVMTTREEIQGTLLDCMYLSFSRTLCSFYIDIVLLDQFRRNGFEKAHTWKSEIGGL